MKIKNQLATKKMSDKMKNENYGKAKKFNGMELTADETKEIESFNEKVQKRIEAENQGDCNKNDKVVKMLMNAYLSKHKPETECFQCTCDDCDNEPPTFDHGIIYVYENIIKMLIEKVFE